jgi:hypothetical protein
MIMPLIFLVIAVIIGILGILQIIKKGPARYFAVYFFIFLRGLSNEKR